MELVCALDILIRTMKFSLQEQGRQPVFPSPSSNSFFLTSLLHQKAGIPFGLPSLQCEILNAHLLNLKISLLAIPQTAAQPKISHYEHYKAREMSFRTKGKLLLTKELFNTFLPQSANVHNIFNIVIL